MSRPLLKYIALLESAIARWAKEGGGRGGVVSRGDVHLQQIARGVERRRAEFKKSIKSMKKAKP